MALLNTNPVHLNIPPSGHLITVPTGRPTMTQVQQTHPLKPLLNGNFTPPGTPHWKLPEVGNIGIGAIGHHFSRGEAIVIGSRVFTFRSPREVTELRRPEHISSPTSPEDQVIFAAITQFNPLDAGAKLLSEASTESLGDILKPLGACVFIIQGVVSLLSVQCVQKSSTEHPHFTAVPKTADEFQNVVTTFVGFYLPDVDENKNVVGPHLHVLVHGPASADVDSCIEHLSFDAPLLGGGHVVRASFGRAYFWYHPVNSNEISIVS